MIRLFEEKDRKDIVDIWQNAFGDSEKFINDFIDNSGAKIFVANADETTVGMVSLFDVCVGENKGWYIYALAVEEKYRGNSIATNLLSFVENKMLDNGYKFSLVVPEPYDTLKDFYQKLGFTNEISLYTTEVLKSTPTTALKIEPANLEEYRLARLSSRGTVCHSKKFFEYVCKDLLAEGYQIFKVAGDFFECFCVCINKGECVIIRETFPTMYSNEISNVVFDFYNA